MRFRWRAWGDERDDAGCRKSLRAALGAAGGPWCSARVDSLSLAPWRSHRLRAELVQLEAEKAKIHEEIERLSARLNEKDNLKLVEYLARKELGMVKPGEEIYILIEDGEDER
jgi:hypothetical protein